MAALSGVKRKGAGGATADAKTSDARPAKKVKSSSKTSTADEKSRKPSRNAEHGAPTTRAAPAVPVISRLKEEEPLFPRGGAGVLTPLEQKQIQVDAKRDALFEEEHGKNDDDKTANRSVKKRRKSAAAKHAENAHADEGVKIEGLNIKRLVKGTLVLGQICEINDFDMVVGLPNNLTGHVAITAVSEALTKRVEAQAAEEEEEEEEGANKMDEREDADLSLKSMFDVGQYVRAYVVSTIDEAGTMAGKTRYKIELSLRPEDANTGLQATDAVRNCTVMAAITSIEDHGYLMGVGIGNSKVTGFLAKDEVDSGIESNRLQVGNALLCTVLARNAKSQVIQLSTRTEKIGNVKQIPLEASTINTLLPGTAIEVLVSEVTSRGVVGKALGSLDATADFVHSGAGPSAVDLEEKFPIGSKLKARVIATLPDADEPKVAVSLLDHVTGLVTRKSITDEDTRAPLDVLPVSSYVEACEVTKIEPGVGLFVNVGVEGVPGFVHISKVKDGKVDALFETSGPFKLGSKHRGRVIGYNVFDGLYLLSFEQSVLDQQYLRIDDVPIGEIVNGIIEKLVIGEDGVRGLIVNIEQGISGFVPETHMSDVRLQHPEKKFRGGMKVKARVLSVTPAKNQMFLTLKKTLVNSELPVVKSFDDVSIGLQTLATVVDIVARGAVMQFYGTLRGFLPVSEMSEAYIKDPKDHFRKGQVVTVHVIDVDPALNRLVVSCKDPSSLGEEQKAALKGLAIGQIVAGKVSQKTEDDVFLELEGSLLKAVLSVGHLADKSMNKNRQQLKTIRVGQTLSDLVILEVNEGRRAIVLSQKKSLVDAARSGKLPSSWDQVKPGEILPGYVRNTTATAAFIQFGGTLTAILPSSLVPAEQQRTPDLGFHKSQSLEVKIISIDREANRAVVAIPSVAEAREAKAQGQNGVMLTVNPVDKSLVSINDVSIGKITKARIASVKSTQLNVRLADNVQGRVDVSQVFDSWDEIPHKKYPLQHFKPNQLIDVRVLGVHDARSHRFLPISHRSSHSLIELSAKPSDLNAEAQLDTITLEKLKVGENVLAFVNNTKESLLWVNVSPNARGRIAAAEASDDLMRLSDLAGNFPIGSALRARVAAVDAAQNRLDLSAKSEGSSSAVTWKTVQRNLVLPAKITKITDRQVFVQLGDELSAPINIVDLDDDYEAANPKKFVKNEYIRVAVIDVDVSNKRLRLSTRPSRVLSSTLPVTDREIALVRDVKMGDIIRGFVKNVADKGLFVALGGDVTAFVKITDLSDAFLKDWKAGFQIDQLVKGRVTAVDLDLKQVSMSLKASVVDPGYVAPLTIADLKPGQTVTGTIRSVEEFGAFVVVDKSANVSGLCHRSEMAEKYVQDARKLYNAGDAVKAKVLKVDVTNNKVSFGLKASYFADEDEDEDMESDEDAGAALDDDLDDEDDDDLDELRGAMDEDIDLVIRGTDNQLESDEDDGDDDDAYDDNGASLGLEADTFDWTGDAMDNGVDSTDVDDRPAANGDEVREKPSRSSQIQVDRTRDLDANGPQSASDFERLLNSEPDSSTLWRAYMAFQLQVGEQDTAREVAERALRTINIREEGEKLSMWIAYLNLENAYGTDESLEEVFARACQYSDEQEVHERLATIFIQSGKKEKADDLFQTMLKKFGSKSQNIWINYAHFLYNTMSAADRARALLPRATQVLEPHTHIGLTTKFAALEFRSSSGDAERGRTIIEGLLATYPKKFDLWGQLLDLEIYVFNTAKARAQEAASSAKGKKSPIPKHEPADPKPVRDVFDRGTRVKGLKPKTAIGWFRRWAKWEEENGDKKSKDMVMNKTREWTREAEARKKAASS